MQEWHCIFGSNVTGYPNEVPAEFKIYDTCWKKYAVLGIALPCGKFCYEIWEATLHIKKWALVMEGVMYVLLIAVPGVASIKLIRNWCVCVHANLYNYVESKSIDLHNKTWFLDEE